MLKHIAETTLQQKAGKPRIWLNSKTRLNASGFIPGRKYDMLVVKNRITLTLNDCGQRMVHHKDFSTGSSPIVDINSKEISESFNTIGQSLCVKFYHDKIVIELTPKENAIKSREENVANQIKKNKPLKIASLFTGSGFMDYSVKKGLLLAAVKSKTIFSNELIDRYLENGLDNNLALKNVSSIQGSIENLIYHDLPEADVLVAGYPCVGFSKAGRAANKLKSEMDHETAGHLFIHMLNAIIRINPAVIVLENVSAATASQTYKVIAKVLENSGYVIDKKVINSHDYGALENRERMIMLAVSKNMAFNLDGLTPGNTQNIKVSDILDESTNEKDWKTYQYMKDKDVIHKERGNNFKINIVTGESTKTSCIGKGYSSPKCYESKLQHPDKPELMRQFTPSEHARIKGFSPDMVSGLPKTVAHEVLGNGVVAHGFIALGEHIGNKLQEIFK